MRPYPGKSLSYEQDVYNYRHSRARRVVENAFGILSERWRVFHTKIAVKPDTVKKIVMATTVLHNMLQRQGYTGTELRETFDSQLEPACALQPLQRMGIRGDNEALDIRDRFSKYFTMNSLPWQQNYVRRGLIHP
ncbi:nuclease harbi1-like protein [Plakobranchus ocellatus]|uniref:Nuclease harbi1-like protein n=1 Tax=Plakobranchus ocellatus TaxID=259542 RepID=A0AAV4DTC1_9GAST|nr:nuclease harbi1-like protein [Plakobranchus ocellatus]